MYLYFTYFLAIDSDENKDENDSGTNHSATDDFFRQDKIENVDKIIEELIKACHKAKKKDESKQQRQVKKDSLPLNDVCPTTSAASNEVFSVGLKDGVPIMGFDVKDSERLFVLTDHQSCRDIGKVYWTTVDSHLKSPRYGLK